MKVKWSSVVACAFSSFPRNECIGVLGSRASVPTVTALGIRVRACAGGVGRPQVRLAN
jgi:hypothetical protein